MECDPTVYVDANGMDISACCDLTLSFTMRPACSSLEFVNNNTRGISPVEIVIQGSLLSLEEPVRFENRSELAIRGNNSTVIKCKSNSPKGAGLVFQKVGDLQIENLTFESCGMLAESTSRNSTTGNTTMKFRCAIYLLNCTNVTITDVVVENSTGTGMAFFDTDGQVDVSSSTFRGNEAAEWAPLYPGGGGVYVEFTYCTPGISNCFHSRARNTNSTYTFSDCKFLNNNASTVNAVTTSFVRASKTDFQGLGRGGGLTIVLKGCASQNKFIISDSLFLGNAAIWGGGLWIQFQDQPQNNLLTIRNTVFRENNCYMNGGGGADIGYIFYDTKAKNNNMTFMNCTFKNNTAKTYGGGVAFFASRGVHYSALSNGIEFHNCSWIGNRALSGSAVDISPHVWDSLGNSLLPVPIFNNSRFISNSLEHNETILSPDAAQYYQGVGAFLVTSFTVLFQGRLEFRNNDGAALYLTSGVADFSEGTSAEFVNNSGTHGGAIVIVAMSVMYANDNSNFHFENNTALFQGGAIYAQSADQHDYLSSHSCFIQYRKFDNESAIDQSSRNITFSFIGNHANTGDGDSIYASSLYPCIHACSTSSESDNPFICVGDFEFDGEGQISTEARRFSVNGNFEVIPGEEYTLLISASDEQGHDKSNVVYQASTSSPSFAVDPGFLFVSNRKIRLIEKEGRSGELRLDENRVALRLNVTLTECPPGFLIYNKSGLCDCAAPYYIGISKCNMNDFYAYVTNGIWVGYCDHSKEKLCTARCPLGFCSYNDSALVPSHRLPSRASELDSFICGHVHRTGILCGSCQKNHSVYYHSRKYRCGPNHKCSLGLLYYVLSELLPSTALFLVVIIFSISFTSGSTTGFVLFAQVLDSLSIDANGGLEFPPAIEVLMSIVHFIYRLFNLDFFGIEVLSFCLWEGATVLNAMAMKYITIVFALGLVLSTVFIMNKCKCRRICPCLRIQTLKGAVVHGLSAVFVMCYSQCARVSFQILTPICLLDGPSCIRHILYRNGELEAMSVEHLKYAIPAMFFLLAFVTLPALLLILFPLSCKLLALCGLSEARIVTRVARLIPVPLLDLFQSCFHDNLRFFAGLYFFYRLFALATYAYSTTFVTFYTLVEVQLILILTIHAVAQPYKKRWHNMVDSFIFADLLVINGLTLFNYIKISEGKDEEETIKTLIKWTSSVQVILMSLPAVYMITYVVFRITIKLKKWLKERKKDTEYTSCDESLPPLRGYDDSHELRVTPFAYHTFND